IETPDQLVGAHESLIMSLEYRAHGIDSLRRSIAGAVGAKDTEAAAKTVTGSMSRLHASDVVWTESVAPDAKEVLAADEADGITVPESVILKDPALISPKEAKAMLSRLRSAGAATTKGVKVPNDGKVRGGQLEGGRLTVAPSGVTLALNALTE